MDSNSKEMLHMQPSTFDAVPRRKKISVFKIGKLWAFKHFFEDRELFKSLLGYYNKDLYRFEMKTLGSRNDILKILEKNGFDYELVEDLKVYVVKLPKFAKYAQILKNSVASKETATERIFLMKDLASVEEALSLGAQIVEVEIAF
jgi:hypothetical protein